MQFQIVYSIVLYNTLFHRDVSSLLIQIEIDALSINNNTMK